VGDLLASTTGTGGRDIEFSGFASGARIAIRFACVGVAGAHLVDQSGALVLDVSGCNGTTIYGTSFTATAANRVLRIGVDSTVTWAIAVWSS